MPHAQRRVRTDATVFRGRGAREGTLTLFPHPTHEPSRNHEEGYHVAPVIPRVVETIFNELTQTVNVTTTDNDVPGLVVDVTDLKTNGVAEGGW